MKLAFLILLCLAVWLGLTFPIRVTPAAADGRWGICWDPYGTFDPLVIGGNCYKAPAPGADEAIVYGRAILDDEYAPPGTKIEALVGEHLCGSAAMPSGSVYRQFALRISGAGEQSDCATSDAVVSFRVGGAMAGQNLRWTGRETVPLLSLSAMPQHAWYWFQRTQGELPPAGTVVTAWVGSTRCGDASIERHIEGPFLGTPDHIAGFRRLIVPASEVEAGCGASGSDVSFAVDGVGSTVTYPWRTGVQRIDLSLYGDPSCDLVVNSIDATLLLQHNAGLLKPLACDDAPDVNGDGQVTAIDATLVLQYDAGLIETLPVRP